MSNRFVAVKEDVLIFSDRGGYTTKEAAKEWTDERGFVAELVPVKEIEELRASAAGEKLLAAQIGERRRRADKDFDEIKALMAQVRNLEAKLAAQLVPVKEVEELRELATSKEKLTAYCVEKDDRIKQLETLLEEHKRQIEDYAVELRMAESNAAMPVETPMPDRYVNADQQLYEQRLWKAYLATTRKSYGTFEQDLSTAKEAVAVFENRHGQEGDKP